MLPNPLAYVDLETTGINPRFDRIIEVGILRVEDGKIVASFTSLVNPHTYLPSEITRITGINTNDLLDAPDFSEVKQKILDVLSGAIFVAHNARFDYGFLKHEFLRHNERFTAKQICTLRLSRSLYPKLPHHNLESLIAHFNLPVKRRHRALDDATAIYYFVKQATNEKKFENVLTSIMKKTAIPLHLDRSVLDALPEGPGVYLFYGDTELPLYIGKSKNIKERILSHFASDITSPSEMKISQQIKRIEYRETAGELSALFLESSLIKTMMPMYNKRLRHSRKLIALKKQTDERGYDRIVKEPFVNGADLQEDLSAVVGIVKSDREAKEFLYAAAKEHGLCPKLLSLEKTSAGCFYHRLGYCQGACIGKESPLRYNMRLITAFSTTKLASWPFPGPIAIEETSFDKKGFLLVNNWCFVGQVTFDEEGNKNESAIVSGFDVDTYKILKSYLKNGQNSVRVLKADELVTKTM
ncbi:MAG: exonuclease domain-containing protein [bacterium]|nr:exonuclease domain-containing protein [bacterium]